MRPNPLREALNAGQRTIGTRIYSTWPSMIEIIGYAGVFDYVEFLAEYVPYDLEALDNMGRAADLHNLSLMIKIDQEPRRFVAQRAVGSGFHSILFADVRSAEDALECVRAVRPEMPGEDGYYGAATRRMALWGHAGSPAYMQAIRDVVVVLMIEKRPAVDALEEILTVPGIDMIQWGGNDYSISVGRPGERNSPEIKAVERHVIETAVRMGIPPRAELGSVDQAQYYLDLGVCHFSIGTDITVLYDWWKQTGQSLRETIAEA